MSLDVFDKIVLLVGCIGLCLASGIVLRFLCVRQDVESYLAEMQDRYEYEATPGDTYDGWDTNEELLDAIIPAQRRLREIELEFCRRAGCDPGDGSDWWDRISAAVRDGRDHSRFLRDLNALECKR